MRLTTTYTSLVDVFRDISLFTKLGNRQQYTLSDFPNIAISRWSYLRDNWNFLRDNMHNIVEGLPDNTTELSLIKARTRTQLLQFSNLVHNNQNLNNNPLNNNSTFKTYDELFRLFLVNDLPLTQADFKEIQATEDRISQLSYDDFDNMRARVRLTHDTLVDGIGLGDSTYNNVYDRVGNSAIISAKITDVQTMLALRRLIAYIESLLPSTTAIQPVPDPFELIRNALNNPKIPLNSYTSGFIIPFPTGTSLERLASTYLGNPDRWMEIVIANGLQFPYIDEEGTKTFFIANGSRDTILLKGSDYTEISIGMEVFIGSDAVSLQSRKVISVVYDQVIDATVLKVNGTANLSNLLVSQRAYVFYYRYATVNGAKFIMIPRAGTSGFPLRINEPYFVKELDPALRNMQVDLQLDTNGDIIFTKQNDVALAYGLVAASQAINLKIAIQLGELLQNPQFGTKSLAGTLTSATNPASAILLMLNKMIAGDARFAGTRDVQITSNGNTINVTATVLLAGNDVVIPLTFTLPNEG